MRKMTMKKYAVFIALATIVTVSMLTGRAAVAGGNPCNSRACYSSAAGLESAVWRMEVLVDEAAYTSPSIRDRLNYNWTNEASRRYRWTSTVMPVDTGVSTQLMTISATVIAAGVPQLRKGDAVEVAVVRQGIDYGRGRASIILRRVCSVRDERCVGEMGRMREGRVSGVEIRCDQAAAYRKPSPPLPNLGSALSNDACRGELAAAPQ
jgi:hypothetical protein